MKFIKMILIFGVVVSLVACGTVQVEDNGQILKNETGEMIGNGDVEKSVNSATSDNEQNNIESTESVATADKVDNNINDEQKIQQQDLNDVSLSNKQWPEIDVNEVKPNELGEVMIAMYHSLSDKNSAYARTPDSFREDLQTYYDMGFRPINLSDYVGGYIDVEAGLTPMVLTFDDGHRSNFNYIEQDGEWIIDPDCSVGILLDFHDKHPDWDLKGSFFLNGGTPFAQKEFVDKKINFLVEKGFEIGNHSYGHEDLTKLSAEEIQKSLGKNIQELEARVDTGDYVVNTLALPFGKRPKDDKYRYDLITSGEYKGISYEHIAILLVGWKPEVSVFDKKFNPLAIMRVQSGDGELQMTDWLADYKAHPQKRYISDGNPYTITIPERFEDKLNVEFIENHSIMKDNVSIVLYDDK